MKHNLSIRWRLAFQFSITVLLILCISGGMVFVLFMQKAQGDIDNLLFIQYKNIQNSLEEHGNHAKDSDLQDETFQEINDQKQIDLVSVIINRQGKIIQKTSKEKIVLPWTQGYSNGMVDRQPYRFYMDEEYGMKVIVGENLEPYEKNIRSLSYILLAVFGAMFALSFSLSALFAKRALAPLRILHDKVRGIQPDNLPNASLASAYKRQDEIGQLALTFDEFLAKLSQAFDREKQFTQDASHELRTPLTVIKSSLELLSLKPEKLNQEQLKKLATMERSVVQMETLVNDLLFLSRGMGRPQEKQTLAVGAFLQKFLEPYHTMAKQKDLRFRVEILHDFNLRTSPMALEKTVGNLIKNALHFTDKGTVTVTVDAPAIRVSDTGIGIAEKDLANIFKRFYQADTSRGEKAKGFGLGLAICHDICEREGWKISAESRLGQGSIFTLKTKP
ncbi:HAMP domain-containing histidine kinase [Candidatus Peregrinibacteria bacterium]|nr:HAMP domain-containing histidine kinase [Candidatus Peregrinibacteria bacterium]